MTIKIKGIEPGKSLEPSELPDPSRLTIDSLVEQIGDPGCPEESRRELIQRLYGLVSPEQAIVYLSQGNYFLNQDIKQKEQKVDYDALTGAYRKEKFGEALEQMVKRSLRSTWERDVSVIVMDLNYLKQINDSEGHLQGDKVLHNVGEIVKRIIRDVDIFGRIGGDEFAIASEINSPSTKHLARRIYDALISDKTYPIEVSIGIAGFDPYDVEEVYKTAGSVEERPAAIRKLDPDKIVVKLISAADTAMYFAKRASKSPRRTSEYIPLEMYAAPHKRSERIVPGYIHNLQPVKLKMVRGE